MIKENQLQNADNVQNIVNTAIMITEFVLNVKMNMESLETEVKIELLVSAKNAQAIVIIVTMIQHFVQFVINTTMMTKNTVMC